MDPKVLSVEAFLGMTGEQLIGREFMRDVHLTLARTGRCKSSVLHRALLPFTVTYRGQEGAIEVSYERGFRAADDQRHVYFFEEGRPVEYEDFLRPEDVISSGLETPDQSQEALERGLKKLKEKGATISMVQVPEGGLKELFNPEPLEVLELERFIIKNTVKVPINDLRTLQCGIYAADPQVLEALEYVPIPFTKPLMRTDGTSVERYNHRLEKWEAVEGEPRFPGLLRGLILMVNRNWF